MRTVAKALKIMDLFNEETPELRLADVAEHVVGGPGPGAGDREAAAEINLCDGRAGQQAKPQGQGGDLPEHEGSVPRHCADGTALLRETNQQALCRGVAG